MAAIHGRAWRHAYASFLPYDALTRRGPEEWLDRWERTLAGKGARTVLVATTADGVVRGFASVGASGDPERAADGELGTLYVDPPAQGAGVGDLLHGAAVAALASAGYASAVLWVFEENAHALAFYAARGWSVDGPPRQEEGWGAPAVRMRRAL